MKAHEWRNPVMEMDSNKRGCYVVMWTGYRWEYWGGPFENEKEAKIAVSYWQERFVGVLNDCFAYEMLDGQK